MHGLFWYAQKFRRSNIKNKIEKDIDLNQSKILENIEIFDKNKKEKEGFLYLKGKDEIKFNKRYV